MFGVRGANSKSLVNNSAYAARINYRVSCLAFEAFTKKALLLSNVALLADKSLGSVGSALSPGFDTCLRASS